VGLAYRLMKSAVARRVLFLVDRRALAAQAVGAFASSPIFAGGATCLIDTQLSSVGRAFFPCLDGF
jgi:type I site-specific restriction endonuclease